MEKKIKKMILSNDPNIHTRPVFFGDDKDTIKDKNKKQFITGNPSTLTIIFEDDTSVNLFAKENYKFDGATIPFGIGKGNMKLQIPALFHDIMCDDKSKIEYNRKLASLIFKTGLIECGVNKYIANYMYSKVELYQILFCNWRKPYE